MMIQAADLLATTKNPTEDQIRTAMNGHLCRCGTYPRILTAIEQAAAVMAKGREVNMTGLHAREGVLPQVFVKGGGALIVGFSMFGTAGKAQAAKAARLRPADPDRLPPDQTAGRLVADDERRQHGHRSPTARRSSVTAPGPASCMSSPKS